MIEDITESKQKSYDKKHKKRSSSDSDESKSDKHPSKKRKKDHKTKFKSKKSHGGDKPPCQYCNFLAGMLNLIPVLGIFTKKKSTRFGKPTLIGTRAAIKRRS